MRLVLPYPPSANRYFRIYRGRAVASAEGKAYKQAVASLVRLARVPVLTGPVWLKVDVFRPPTFIPNAQNRDLLNNEKTLGDALQGFAYVNDGQTFRMTLEHWDVPEGQERVQVEIAEDATPRPPPEAWPMDSAYADAFQRARASLSGVHAAVREKDKARAKRRKAKVPSDKARLASLATPAVRKAKP